MFAALDRWFARVLERLADHVTDRFLTYVTKSFATDFTDQVLNRLTDALVDRAVDRVIDRATTGQSPRTLCFLFHRQWWHPQFQRQGEVIWKCGGCFEEWKGPL